MGSRHLFLALPCRPDVTPVGEDGVMRLVNPSHRGMPIEISTGSSSLLNLNFNRLWVKALRSAAPLTHFGMQHDDIKPASGWADVLIDELERTGADVLSVVVPIKDQRGLTSTAVRDWVNGTIRRLTMTEVMALPETFGVDDVPGAGPDDTLVVNTGLWVCRWGDWCRPPRFPGFRCLDQIQACDDGGYQAVCMPEDWMFSEWATRRGLKVLATRKVACAHRSARAEYRNDHAWGTCAVDPGGE